MPFKSRKHILSDNDDDDDDLSNSNENGSTLASASTSTSKKAKTSSSSAQTTKSIRAAKPDGTASAQQDDEGNIFWEVRCLSSSFSLFLSFFLSLVTVSHSCIESFYVLHLTAQANQAVRDVPFYTIPAQAKSTIRRHAK